MLYITGEKPYIYIYISYISKSKGGNILDTIPNTILVNIVYRELYIDIYSYTEFYRVLQINIYSTD